MIKKFEGQGHELTHFVEVVRHNLLTNKYFLDKIKFNVKFKIRVPYDAVRRVLAVNVNIVTSRA